MPNLPRIKTFTFPGGVCSDQEVNDWVDEHGYVALGTSIGYTPSGALNVAILYTDPAEPVTGSSPESAATRFRGTVVSREVERIEEGKIVGMDHCMAGVFPVPEYHALSGEDLEAAPMVLLSPDLKLEPYSDWFQFPKDYAAIAKLRARPEEAASV